MKTGYQIYKRRKGENAFISAGLLNWFALEEEAVAKCEKHGKNTNTLLCHYMIE